MPVEHASGGLTFAVRRLAGAHQSTSLCQMRDRIQHDQQRRANPQAAAVKRSVAAVGLRLRHRCHARMNRRRCSAVAAEAPPNASRQAHGPCFLRAARPIMLLEPATMRRRGETSTARPSWPSWRTRDRPPASGEAGPSRSDRPTDCQGPVEAGRSASAQP